ncbi:uncharacterized protein [Argopecten irradians]|uniref:uncharacterized protein n=1 Tax=Argopecten irradians TaxID=31199 RepID=UPI0037205FBB
MLLKGAVEEVPMVECTPGFYSRMFLVRKKSGAWRPIIDLSAFNRHVDSPHFKMETPRSIIASVREGMWATSVDLRDAYFHIPIKKSARKFLRFTCNGKVFQFRAMPFGLTTAPLVFTKLLQVVVGFLHSRGIDVHIYFDDSLMLHLVRESLVQNTRLVLKLLLKVGFIPSKEKSEVSPSRDFVFLGNRFNTVQGIALPPLEKFEKARDLALTFTSWSNVQVRWFLSFLGYLNSLADVVPLGRLHIRPLQMFLLANWVPASREWEAWLPLNQSVKEFARWWTLKDNVLHGVPLSKPAPTMTLFTDASMTGWGAYLDGHGRSGEWSGDQLSEHINVLEMRAVLLALQAFRKILHSKVVCVATDNSTVVAYLERQGGDKVPCPMCPRYPCSSSLSGNAFNYSSQASSRQVECSGRYSLQAPPAGSDRMATKSLDLRGHLSGVGQASYRPFRHFPEQSAANLCLSGARPIGLGCGRAISGLGGDAGLCIPSIQPGGQGSTEVSDASLLPPSDSALVAETTMVSGAIVVSGGCSSGSSTQIQSPAPASVTDDAFMSRDPPPSRVKAISGGLAQAGFSSDVSARIARSIRSSSSAVYQSRWKIFCDWCIGRKIDPIKASVQLIADFLLYLFRERNLASGTIAGYRTTIASVLSFHDRREVGSSTSLSALIRGFSLDRPRVRQLAPQWNLALVLESLKGAPYEPLGSVSLKFLSFKTVFLLAFASGRRRSDIHALSVHSSCIRWTRDSSAVTLLTDPAFLAKNQGQQDISSQSISRWICQVIKIAYELSNDLSRAKCKVRAHEVRALAASLALLNGSSFQDIMSAAFWRGQSTFTDFYLRSLSSHSEGLFSLGPVVAAQSVTVPPP